MGRKRSTTYRTLITPTVVPVGSVLSLPSNSFTSQTTYYSGNMELRYGSPATTWTYHTPVGYVKVDDLDNEDTMDWLDMSYDGNQLVKVTDGGYNPVSYSTKHYQDLENAQKEMFYDKNGALIADFDRNTSLPT